MKVQLIALVGLVAATTMAMAANNAAPLGFEVGVTTRSAVQTGLHGRTDMVEKGVNRFSGGVVLEANGNNLGVENLQRVTFIFDRQERLAAVELQFPKGAGNQNTAKIADALKLNYQQVSRNTPPVGNGSARFVQGASVVQLEAPHMSFDFTVFYMTTEFENAYKQTVATERSERERSTRSKL